MRKETRISQFLLILLVQHCYLAEAEAANPVVSPQPEANRTFNGRPTWCVALPGVSQIDLQNALDWACGPGMADCNPIQKGGSCFEPDTLPSHASYAFNSYYQKNGNLDAACNFGGTATTTKHNPSYKKCVYPASGSVSSSAPTFYKQKPSLAWWKVASILLLLYLRS